MSFTAKLRYLRIAPRKVRLMADLIRGKSAEEARVILNFTTVKSAHSLSKLLKSALASAIHNFQSDPANLYISKITVDEGPKLKRWRPRARGQAYEIQKKTSHVTLLLDEIKKTPAKASKKTSQAKKLKEAEKIEEIKESETEPKESLIEKPAKPKFKPGFEMFKPKIGKSIKRIFRRKAF